MGKKSHMSGGKLTGSHTTVIDKTRIVVQAANRDPYTHKIALQNIDPKAGSRVIRLKMKDCDAGLEVAVYQTGPVQFLIIYTTNRQATREVLSKAFKRAFPAAIIN